jgi:hypothetical protein
MGADDPPNLEREGVMSDRPAGVPDDWPYPNEEEGWRRWGYSFGEKLLPLTDDPRPGWALEVAYSYAMLKASAADLAEANRMAVEAVTAAEEARDMSQFPADAAVWCTAPTPDWGTYRRPDHLLVPRALILRWEETRDVVAALRQYADGDRGLLRLAERIEEGRPPSICPSCGGEVELDEPFAENAGWDRYGLKRNATCSQCGLPVWLYMGSGRISPRKSD